MALSDSAKQAYTFSCSPNSAPLKSDVSTISTSAATERTLQSGTKMLRLHVRAGSGNVLLQWDTAASATSFFADLCERDSDFFVVKEGATKLSLLAVTTDAIVSIVEF
jgi:hypothetical protein